MRIMLANQYLQPVADLLTGMPLRAAQSRARSKLLTLVKQALARFGKTNTSWWPNTPPATTTARRCWTLMGRSGSPTPPKQASS